MLFAKLTPQKINDIVNAIGCWKETPPHERTNRQDRLRGLYAEVNAHAWYGLFAPAGSPREVISRIHRDVVRIITEPGFRDREITGKGFDLVANSPEEFAVFLHQDRLNYGAGDATLRAALAARERRERR